MSIVVYVYRLNLKVSLYLHNVNIKIFRQSPYEHFITQSVIFPVVPSKLTPTLVTGLPLKAKRWR